MDSSFEYSYTSNRNSNENESCADSLLHDNEGLVVNDSLDQSANNSLAASSFSENSDIINDSTDSPASSITKKTPNSYKSGNETPKASLYESFKHIRHTPGSFDSDSNDDSVESAKSDEEELDLLKYNQTKKADRVPLFSNKDKVAVNENVKLTDSFSKTNISPKTNNEDLSSKSSVYQSGSSTKSQKSSVSNESDVSESPVSKSEGSFKSINDSFSIARNPGTIQSESDSDEEYSPRKTPAKNRRKVRTIQSDSEDEVVISIPSTRSSSPIEQNVINVSSEEEELKQNKAAIKKRFNESVLKQATLDSMVHKMHLSPQVQNNIKAENNLTPPVNKDVIYCTQKEYTIQATKVSGLRADVKRTNMLQATINKAILPDKGANIKQRQIALEQSLKKEEEILNKMVVENEELRDTKPNVAVPWEQLQASSAAVVPRTWGKQAMQTHTMQKSLTMDRLKDLHGSLATCPGEDTLADDPKHLKVELMKHQKRALAWLMWRESQKPSGGILADDMGLGKTLTMISLVIKSNEEKYDVAESDNEKENDEKSNGEKDGWIGKKTKRALIDGGTLVVCPATLLKQWEGEVVKRCKRGLLNVEVYHGTNRESKARLLAKQDMIITTYNLAMRECEKKGPLFQIKWRRIILDEAHVVRNSKSQTSIAMCSLHGKSRWALTGTPVHNKELDLYALLKFLRCSPFDDLTIWKRWVINKNAGGQDRLNTVMRSIMLRRTKLQLQTEGALTDLPEKKFELIQVTLDKMETKLYQKVMLYSRTLFAQFLHQRAEKNTDLKYDRESNRPNFLQQNDPNSEYYKMHKKMVQMNGTKEIKSHEILVLLLRLRQICCHPSIADTMLDKGVFAEEGIEEDGLDIDILDKLKNLEIEDDDVFNPNENAQNADGEEKHRKASVNLMNKDHPVFDRNRANGKIKKVLEIIRERVIPNNEKAIIVSQWTSMLRLVLSHFTESGIHCDMLDGSVPVLKRNELVENFNNPQHKMKVLFLSLTAGGVGLNLVGGNHLILLDLHWNPQLESQAQDRIYRVGQKKTVIIYKLVTVDTIEERIKALQDNKLQMATDILSGSKIVPGSKLSLDDIKMLFSI